jgi:hypothetical protein
MVRSLVGTNKLDQVVTSDDHYNNNRESSLVWRGSCFSFTILWRIQLLLSTIFGIPTKNQLLFLYHRRFFRCCFFFLSSCMHYWTEPKTSRRRRRRRRRQTLDVTFDVVVVLKRAGLGPGLDGFDAAQNAAAVHLEILRRLDQGVNFGLVLGTWLFAKNARRLDHLGFIQRGTKRTRLDFLFNAVKGQDLAGRIGQGWGGRPRFDGVKVGQELFILLHQSLLLVLERIDLLLVFLAGLLLTATPRHGRSHTAAIIVAIVVDDRRRRRHAIDLDHCLVLAKHARTLDDHFTILAGRRLLLAKESLLDNFFRFETGHSGY